jgi:hypothetical protein
MQNTIRVVVIVIGVFAFALLIWPGLYHYHHIQSRPGICNHIATG